MGRDNKDYVPRVVKITPLDTPAPDLNLEASTLNALLNCPQGHILDNRAANGAHHIGPLWRFVYGTDGNRGRSRAIYCSSCEGKNGSNGIYPIHLMKFWPEQISK